MRALLKDKTRADRPSSNLAQVTQAGPSEGFWEDEINVAGSTGAPQDSAPARAPHFQPKGASGSVPVSYMPVDDVIARNVLDISTARELLDKYRTVLVKQFPIPPIQTSYTVEQMRIEKPTLFLAIMAAAATLDHPEVSRALDAEILRVYAERCLINSEKSLELIQSLLLSAAWYAPPEKFTQLKYYKYIHMAAVMSMELGIGTRSPSKKRQTNANGRVHPAEDVRNPDLSMAPRTVAEESLDTTEARRTFLTVFCLTTSTSFTLRRPTLLKATPYFKDCLEHFETAAEALWSDRVLVAWTKLSIITADFSETFCFDDPENLADITDVKTQLLLKDYERRLTQWDAAVPAECFLPGMRITYHFCRMALHEVALHIDHSPEDFKAPYQMGGLHPRTNKDLPAKLLVDCISECVSSAHTIMDTYLSLNLQDTRALPVLTAVRISFAAFIIAKLCLSSMSKESRIAGLIDRSSLKAEVYIDKMILHARNVIGSRGRRVPAILMALLFKVRQWCANPEVIARLGTQQKDSQIGAQVFDISQADEPQADGAEYLGDSTTNTASSASPGNGFEQMDLNPDFFAFLDDVNTYSGGLDWAPTSEAFPVSMTGSTTWSAG